MCVEKEEDANKVSKFAALKAPVLSPQTWASRRRLFKPARMPKSDAPMDARVKWGRMLLDAREARKCYKMLDKFSPFFYTSATSRVCARSNQLVANSRPAVSSSRPAVFQQFFGTFWHFRSS